MIFFQKKLAGICLLISLCNCFHLHAQRFKDASHFVGSNIGDPLLGGNGDMIASQELCLFQAKGRTSPNAVSSDARIFDGFNLGGSSPTISPMSTYGYEDRSAYPLYGSTAYDWKLHPTTKNIAGDWDGDGLDGMIRVMVTENHDLLLFKQQEVDMFAQQNIFLQNNSPIDTLLVPHNTTLPMPIGHPQVKLTKVPWGSDERDQLVITQLHKISDTTYSLMLTLWQDQVLDTFMVSLPHYFDHAGFLIPRLPHFDVELIDFELDDEPELVLIYGQNRGAHINRNRGETVIRVFGHNQSKLLQTYKHTEVPRHLGVWYDLEAGDFNGDLVPELALAEQVYHARGNITGYLYNEISFLRAMDDSLKSGINLLDTLISTPVGVSYPNSYTGNPRTYENRYVRNIPQIEVGDIDRDGKDEVIYLRYMYIEREGLGNLDEYDPRTKFSLLVSFNVNDQFDLQSSAQFSLNRSNGPYVRSAIPEEPLAVADMDGDGTEEIILYEPQTPGNGDTFQETISLLRYSGPSDFAFNANQGVLNRTIAFRNPTSTTSGLTLSPPNRYHSIQFVLGDFDGDGIRLGKPKFYQRNHIQQPLVILNAPPIHFDELNGQLFDLNGCYTSTDPCNFWARYVTTQQTSFTATTEFQRDWGISTEVSASAKSLMAEVSANITATYGNSFSKRNGKTQSISIEKTVDASVEDRIYAVLVSYGIYEYPVYSRDSLVGHILTVSPELEQQTTNWFSTESWLAYDYFPRHEVGCLLSYPGTFTQQQQSSISLDPSMSQLIKSFGDRLSVDNTSLYQQSISISDINTESRSHTSELSVGAEVQAKAKAKFFGWGVEVEASVSGDYSQTTISSHETAVSNEISMTVNLGANISRLESNYLVTPYLYWGKNGALILDYTVDVELEANGGTPTWWSTYYNQKTDLALILPWRLHPEKDLILQDPIKRYQSRSITYSPRNVQAGDTITIYAAIHNFSLVPTQGPVSAAFYLGNPNCDNSQRLRSIDGDSIASTGSTGFISIPARGRELVAFRWKIPDQITSFPRIFVQLDPENREEEIHENNNLGWTILEVQGNGPTAYCSNLATSLNPLNQAPFVSVFPNPFSDLTQLKFTLEYGAQVSLEVVDLTGKTVDLLVDQLLGSGTHSYKFYAKDLPNGIYLYRLKVDEAIESGRLLVNHL